MATIGLSPEANKELTVLKTHFGFGKEIDVALFAMAFALYHKLPTFPVTNKMTKWGTSSVDTPELENIFSVLYPDFNSEEERMITLMESFIHAGIHELFKLVDENRYLKISDLFPPE